MQEKATPRAVTRRVVVRREIHAPLGRVQERLRQPTSCRLFVHAARAAQFTDDRIHADMRFGPILQHYEATWGTGPGIVMWASFGSSGSVRCTGVDPEHTTVEVDLRWRPRTPLGIVVARTEIDRRRVERDLARLALVLESEAADDRLGPLTA
jgi:hypothetical protein